MILYRTVFICLYIIMYLPVTNIHLIWYNLCCVDISIGVSHINLKFIINTNSMRIENEMRTISNYHDRNFIPKKKNKIKRKTTN